jgi:uncharacterized membrane protein
MGDGVEVNWIMGMGIIVSIVGMFMIIVGAVLWSQTDTDWTWYGPVRTHPNADLGMSLARNGILITILGVVVIAVGFTVLKLGERRKERGLVPVPEPPN